jgi:hypothetical protein
VTLNVCIGLLADSPKRSRNTELYVDSKLRS